MGPFAEEARDVGGQRRQHLQPLVSAFGRLDQVAVGAEGLEFEHAHALGQSRVDQRRLRVPEIDAGVRMISAAIRR